MAIAVPTAVGGIILAKPIIELLYGGEYLPGTLTLQILMGTILVAYPGAIVGNSVIAYDAQKKVAIYALAASLGNVLLNALLIPRYGISGAATATLMVQASYQLLVWNFIKGVNNFYTLRHLKRISLATVLMAVSAFVLNGAGIQIIANVIISASVY